MSPRSCLYYLWFSSYKTHKNYHGLSISISIITITIHPVTLIRLLYTLASFVSLAHDLSIRIYIKPSLLDLKFHEESF